MKMKLRMKKKAIELFRRIQLDTISPKQTKRTNRARNEYCRSDKGKVRGKKRQRIYDEMEEIEILQEEEEEDDDDVYDGRQQQHPVSFARYCCVGAVAESVGSIQFSHLVIS